MTTILCNFWLFTSRKDHHKGSSFLYKPRYWNLNISECTGKYLILWILIWLIRMAFCMFKKVFSSLFLLLIDPSFKSYLMFTTLILCMTVSLFLEGSLPITYMTCFLPLFRRQWGLFWLLCLTDHQNHSFPLLILLFFFSW